ncbi:MAG: c-type cytochrome biogenesis protein CcsB [Nitrospirae bacterium]|nr:c-type cytochrome biogenesis protein CcsB [Nitrospirota bacterium]
MNSFFLFDITFWLYFIAAILYIVYMVTNRVGELVPAGHPDGGSLRSKAVGQIATILTASGWVANTFALVARALEAKHAPYANLFESMMLMAWGIIIGYLILEYIYKIKIIGVFVVSLGFLTIAIASLLPFRYQTVEPLNPALQSNWLLIHVLVTFLGYAAFAIAFGLSIMYLLKERAEKKGLKYSFFMRFPDCIRLDELSYKSIAFGFPFLTFGIISGAIWANYAWGGYWSWDPKETWSLIVWFIYAAYLHARMTRGWRGRRTAIFSVVGFISVIFLYWGVSFILPGLHAYA